MALLLGALRCQMLLRRVGEPGLQHDVAIGRISCLMLLQNLRIVADLRRAV